MTDVADADVKATLQRLAREATPDAPPKLRGTKAARGPRDDGTRPRADVLADRDKMLALTLQESAVARAAQKKRFGFIPTSVLKLSRGILSNQMFNYQREQPSK